MKLKRMISIFMAALMIYLAMPGVCAVEIEDDNIGVIIHDEETNARIDELFALRSQLELDFEANAEQIEYIDQQLVQLGVEMLTYGEIL